jgi:hypothetical protein
VSKQTAAVGYVRVRVGRRGGDSFLSPELQREQIAFAARREGLEIVDVLEELDASGGDRTREKWNEAIRRVEDGEVGAAGRSGSGSTPQQVFECLSSTRIGAAHRGFSRSLP